MPDRALAQKCNIPGIYRSSKIEFGVGCRRAPRPLEFENSVFGQHTRPRNWKVRRDIAEIILRGIHVQSTSARKVMRENIWWCYMRIQVNRDWRWKPYTIWDINQISGCFFTVEKAGKYYFLSRYPFRECDKTPVRIALTQNDNHRNQENADS